MTFTFSRVAARIFGPLIIAIETWRRWQQFGDVRIWPAIVDDYLAGAFLFFAARIAQREPDAGGRVYLAGAWGAATGMMYGSFFSQLHRSAEADPSGLPVVAVLVVKGIGLLICLAGLIGALRGRHQRGGGEVNDG